MDVGTTLQVARERQGMTLAQVAARTKIPLGILRSLEQNAFEKVPRGIFVRGFLRAYASEVGLDPMEIVSQFRSESGDVVPSAAEAPGGPARTVEEIEPAQIDPDLTASGPGWGYVLIVAALLVAVVSVNRSNAPDDAAMAPVLRGEERSPAAHDRQAAPSGVQPVATAGQQLPALGANGLSMVRLDIEVQAPCWVEATVDGRRLVYRLMQTGERQAIEYQREIVLRVGDPGAFTYTINGKAGEPIGAAGVPVTVRFTNGGQRATLAS